MKKICIITILVLSVAGTLSAADSSSIGFEIGEIGPI